MKIAIHDDCNTKFKELKFEKVHRYVIYKIEKETVILERAGDKTQGWKDFLGRLPHDEYRFCVYDIEFKSNDGINVSKLFFLTWLPDGAKIKTKMMYATAKQSFKNYLDMNGKEINISTVDELTEQDLIKQFNK